MHKSLRSALVVAVLSALMVGVTAPAFAHEIRKVGKYEFTVGWGEEPAYAGFKNSVQFILKDSKGQAVTDLGDSLKVEVIFAGQTKSYPLEPTFDPDTGLGTPGDYRAWLIPTRPGNYTFHFTGSIHGQKVDQRFSSSPTTFDPVTDPASVQFPAQDPSTGQLNTLLTQQAARLSGDVKTAKDKASTATLLAIIGLAIGVVGVGTALTARRSRKQA
jgi:hypothetical protein